MGRLEVIGRLISWITGSTVGAVAAGVWNPLLHRLYRLYAGRTSR